MIAAGTTGLITATATGPGRTAVRGRPEADGTPEQIHLTWDDDPARTVVVSWVSPGQAARPRVRIGQRVISAAERSHTDPATGSVTWTYHARVDGLRPGATYGYAVTADNDGNAADPFSATFTTAPEGRAAFRFTSFGDLAAPYPAGAENAGQTAYAVAAVETFQPLFHLLNGDLAYADPSSGPADPAVFAHTWRDFGQSVQASAAHRPWLPVPGNHALELGLGEQGLAAFLAWYALPPNGVTGLEGRWYAFRVGTALFVCLSGDDVAYSSSGDYFGQSAPAAVTAEPGPLPAQPAGGPPTAADGGRTADSGYSAGAQTRWLELTLAAARADSSIDWIIVQLHQCACSSAPDDSGSDLGIRRAWLPLFDTYEVDLVLSGHDHGYERSFPVRGADLGAGADAVTGAVTDTSRPRPVTTVDSGVFDTSLGTVHLVLGSGGSDPGPVGSGPVPSPRERTARVVTRPAAPGPDPRVSGRYPHPAGSAVEAATWSARRVPSTGYGFAVFDVNPGSEAGGQTSVTVRYYHAAAGAPGGPADDYTLFEAFTLVRPRSDGRRWHPKQQ
jgi:Purple acid Phosphatase, N-terminal domain/Calcineurin-like phosphoesterase